MQPARPDVRGAQFVQLSGPCNGQAAGNEVEPPPVHRECHFPRLQKNNFNALVPMFIESPILGAGTIPETDAVQAWQQFGRKLRAGIVAFRQGVQLDFPLPHGANLRLAGVNLVRPAADLIDGLKARLFHVCSLSFAEGICKTRVVIFCQTESMNPILGKWGALLGLLAASTGTVAVETGAASWPKADPAAIANWQAKRFGMFIHFGPVSLTGREIGWSRGNETPIAVYDNLYRQFNPTNFNAETWVSVAKAAGMK
jgi:hypothetical protein